MLFCFLTKYDFFFTKRTYFAFSLLSTWLSTMKQGDNALGSICPSVRPSVCVCLWICLSELPCLNCWTIDLSECSKGKIAFKFEAKMTITSPRYLFVIGGLLQIISPMWSVSFKLCEYSKESLCDRMEISLRLDTYSLKMV